MLMALDAGALAVTPLAGVWIEIGTDRDCTAYRIKSHPSRVCGLKYIGITSSLGKAIVTPLAGVWIEI